MTKHKRAWIYCRTAQPDATALEAQKEHLTAYARGRGFTVAGVTAEHGSGLDLSRAGMQEVSNAAEKGLMDIVLTKDVTRLGRVIPAVADYLDWLKSRHVEVVCMDGFTLEDYTADTLRKLVEAGDALLSQRR